MRVPALALAVLPVTLSGLPAPAQEMLLCGDAGARGSWVGGTEADSDIATSVAPYDLGGRIEPGGDLVALFRLGAPAAIRVEALPDGNGDTVIALLAEDGTLIVEDDDSGGALASMAEAELPAGRYCLVARAYDAAATSATLRVGRTDHPRLTVGDEPPEGTLAVCDASTEATPLAGAPLAASSLPLVRQIVPDSARYHRFVLDAPMALTLTAEGEAADPHLYLYNADGALLAENDDTDGLNARIDLGDPPLDAGAYCIALGTHGDATSPVDLRLAAFDRQAAAEREFAAGTRLPPLDGSWRMQDLGLLDTELAGAGLGGGDADWFTFTLAEPGLVLLQTATVGRADPVLTLFAEDGRQIARNDDSPAGGLDSQIAVPIEPGRYAVSISVIGDSGWGIVGLTAVRYVRAAPSAGPAQ